MARAVPTPSAALRRARQAWNLLHVDSARALAQAEQAIVAARAARDRQAEAWARLTRGFHRLYYATVAEATAELEKALALFVRCGDRAGAVLAEATVARAMWRAGRVNDALARVLPLRDEGVRVLRHDQRGVLLNTIAGCYSAQGDSAQAFAYMYEALRDAGPSRGRGFDTVLHCNIAHELMQIGDCEHALRHVDEGLARCRGLNNARLRSVLWINRIGCLTELGRADECLPDLEAVLALPADGSGRGPTAAGFETLALAALRAGRLALGAELVARAQADAPTPIPDEQLERAAAAALLALCRGDAPAAVAHLAPLGTLAARDDAEGLSLRARVQFFGLYSEALEAAGDAAGALAALRRWQGLREAQARLASRARYEAANLQTELLRLQHRIDESVATRRRSERARAELAAINTQLSNKVAEVQALQAALRQQATQDPLTGLFNRRHLNDTLPTLFALAQRERQTMALAIIDMDHFKLVNDRHGHAAGDRLLAAFGELLAAQIRRSDVACRYGGEEFCLLMPRTDAAGARRKVGSLLRRWRAMRFELGAATLEGLSFSAGISDTALAPGSPDALLNDADAQLLAAKRAGRNRVGTAVPATP